MAADSSSPLDPDQIAGRGFDRARKGFDTDQVRSYLLGLAGVVREHVQRHEALNLRVAELERRAADPRDLDEETVTELLGEQTARLLVDARRTSTEMIEQAEADASRIRLEATTAADEVRAAADEHASGVRELADEADEKIRADADAFANRVRETAERETAEQRAAADEYDRLTRENVDEELATRRAAVENEVGEMRRRAETVLTERTAEAEQVATGIRTDADEYAESVRTDADAYAEETRSQADRHAENARADADGYRERVRAEADAERERIVAAAKDEGREMVQEAREYRERIIADLGDRRRAARHELEKMAASRDALAVSITDARLQLERAHDLLQAADIDPSLAGDTAVDRRALIPSPMGPDAEGEVGDDDLGGDDDEPDGTDAASGVFDRLAGGVDDGRMVDAADTPTGDDDEDEGGEAPRADDADLLDDGSGDGSGDEAEAGETEEVDVDDPAADDADPDRDDHLGADGPDDAEDDEAGDPGDEGDDVEDGVVGDLADGDADDADRPLGDETVEAADAIDVGAADVDVVVGDPTDGRGGAGATADTDRPVSPVVGDVGGADVDLAIAQDETDEADGEDDGSPSDERVPDTADGSDAETTPLRLVDDLDDTDEDDGAVAPGIDDLFARIRAEQADAPEDAPGDVDDAAVTDVADEPDAAVTGAAAGTAGATGSAEDPGDPIDDDAVDGDGDDAAESDRSEDEELLDRRDAETDEIERQLARRLKRELADEQNELLDALRRSKGEPDRAEVLPSPDEHLARYRDALLEDLRTAERAGAAFYGGTPGAEADVADIANDLASDLVRRFRARMDRAFDDGGGEEDIAEAVRTLYREWKTQRIAEAARHFVVTAFSRGVLEAAPDGSGFVWLVDHGGDPAPDCEDNALEGRVERGEPFPTGDLLPPVHPGCRCLLVRVDS